MVGVNVGATVGLSVGVAVAEAIVGLLVVGDPVEEFALLGC